MVCCCHCCLGLHVEAEPRRAAGSCPSHSLAAGWRGLSAQSFPLVPAFSLLFKDTHRKPHRSQGREACACSGVLVTVQLFQSTRHARTQKNLLLCSTRCFMSFSEKSANTSLKLQTKNNRRTTALKQHYLYWLAVSLRNWFLPKLQSSLFFFAFFVFQ